MHILMLKQREDSQFVWYKFEIKVEKDKSLDHKGRECTTTETKYGVFNRVSGNLGSLLPS